MKPGPSELPPGLYVCRVRTVETIELHYSVFDVRRCLEARFLLLGELKTRWQLKGFGYFDALPDRALHLRNTCEVIGKCGAGYVGQRTKHQPHCLAGVPSTFDSSRSARHLRH